MEEHAGKRTDYAKMTQQPEVVRLGGRDFALPPLVIRKQREFQGKLFGKIRGMADAWGNAKVEDTKTIQDIVNSIEVFLSDDLLDMVCLACSDFDKAHKENEDWVLDNVTHAELQSALVDAIVLNFPFLKSLRGLVDLGMLANTKKN